VLDLKPATRLLADLVAGLRDDQLQLPTPCTQSSLGDLIDHVDGLSMAFAAAARKSPLSGPQAPSADASRLDQDWRTRIPAHLADLAAAWQDESAWTGMTEAGGLALPAEQAGFIAIDEVLVHGWDIAVASSQPYSCEPVLAQAALRFVEPTVARNPGGTPGLFGPPVPVPDDAPLVDRLLGLTGRDPSWMPAG
jgi:uncharacterized protein (TIGR03086 family)